ncbi:MAG TPA: FHA domain-containing protein [Humisphaera sp.]|jgi:hypothetical protein|nr:FHA domain-containing protein [Humisphaera sp.]
MDDGKISISWDELKTRRVENRLREQQAVARNRAYSQLKEDALPEATPTKISLWQNTLVVMTIFGLLGGLLAWGARRTFTIALPWIGPHVLHYDAKASDNSKKLQSDILKLTASVDLGQKTQQQADAAIEVLQKEGRANPYYILATDATLSDRERARREAVLQAQDTRNNAIIELISFGLWGLMIAVCLSIAEPLAQHKYQRALTDGLAGALLGLMAGVAAAALSGHLVNWITATFANSSDALRNSLKFAGIFGVLGLLLGIAWGLVSWNRKKLMFGAIGGLVGGLLGGALATAVLRLTGGSQEVANLVALLFIGGVCALGTGFIENAAKAGWLKVTTGIIAGKQFILYRNPTYIGSAPDCQIYLFKDPKVGKRHAAIHLTPAGIEIEDLPLGIETFVNGKPIKRAPLHNGDQIAIGTTQFIFKERRPAAGK